MECKICGAPLMDEDKELCSACIQNEENIRRKRAKSFWGEVEKNHTTIEEFGYRVKTEIKKSEDTVIYIATNDKDDTVAIKRITVPFVASDSNSAYGEISRRVRSEMEVLSRISAESGNRFIITYYDYKLVESSERLKYDLYIKMDYLTSLGQLFSDSKLRISDLLNMGIDICNALEWCHKNGYVHNNLNLNNIFINNDGHYVLGDFIFSDRTFNEVEYCTAPELFYGESPSWSSDIYSLGIVIFVLLNNGLPPFAEKNEEEDLEMAVKRLKNGEMPVLPNNINQRLRDVICKAISPQHNRYGSVEDFRIAIEYLLKSMPEEWLNQFIGETVIETSEPVVNEVKQIDFPQDAEEKKFLEKKAKKELQKEIQEELHKPNQPEDLTPEEIVLKKKNIKDFWVIGVVVIVLIAAVTLGTMFLYSSGNREIYSLIESESYAVALNEIDILHKKGQNVDDLVTAYVDACMSDKEYKRVVLAVPLYSQNAFSNREYFKNMLTEMIDNGDADEAGDIAEYLYQYENLRSVISEVFSKQN